MTVEITKHADKDIDDIEDFIATNSRFYAQKTSNKIYDVIENLSIFPNMGQRVPEIPKDWVREYIYDNYHIIYGIKKDKIKVYAVIHSARDFKEAIKDYKFREDEVLYMPENCMKDRIIKLIDSLPDDVDIDGMMKALYEHDKELSDLSQSVSY